MEKTNHRATIDDVAAYAGVSIATVSRVLNQNVPVAEKTAKRVFEAIEKLNYQPRAAARILASQKTNTIGLLLPEVGGPFFFPIMQGIEACAHENGYNLLIHTVSTPLASGPRMMPLGLGEHNTDGLIVFAHSLNQQELQRLHSADFPVVLLHQSPPPGLDIPNVTFENKSGAHKMVEHLIVEHDCHRIAFMAGPKEHEDSYWREMGYLEALHAHGIDFDPALILDGYFDPQRAKQSVEQMLKDGLDVDAIFAADDESASGAMMALREAGLRIPEDIAVVGFDDTLLASHVTPALTTVHAPIEQAGQQAAAQLIKKIAGEPAEAVTLLPTEVIIRKSCGCD